MPWFPVRPCPEQSGSAVGAWCVVCYSGKYRGTLLKARHGIFPAFWRPKTMFYAALLRGDAAALIEAVVTDEKFYVVFNPSLGFP